jgi:hypothetical protein
VNVIPFEPEHIQRLELQDAQQYMVSHICVEYLKALQAVGPSASAEVDGRIIASAGVAFQGFGMGVLWAFVAKDAGRHFVKLDRCVRRLLSITSLKRIEATTEVSFHQGCRWLELLGFENEGRMRAYGPNGEDHYRFARISWPLPSLS